MVKGVASNETTTDVLESNERHEAQVSEAIFNSETSARTVKPFPTLNDGGVILISNSRKAQERWVHFVYLGEGKFVVWACLVQQTFMYH